MEIVVVTGSTRGIGFGLARAFLERGCAVVVGGRGRDASERAAAELAADHPAERILAQPCDVTRSDELQRLWDAACGRFGRVDVWINNAGLGAESPTLAEQSPESIERVVATNLTGTLLGARVALRGMLEQGGGSVYLMEGLGSDGRRARGLTLYGTTKAAVRYLAGALAAETEGTPVIVGTLSPGMVVTDLLVGGYRRDTAEWKRVRRLFNILADRVETVAPWLAERVLENRRNGATIAWLTRGKALRRFLAAPLRRRELFDDRAGGASG